MDSQKIAAFFESVDSLFIDGDDDAFDDSDAFFLDTPMKNPENLDLLLAVAYAKRGDSSKSREMIKRCIKNKPGWKQALVLKAIIDGKMTSSEDDDDDYSYEDNEEDKIEDDEDEDEDEKQEIEKDLLMAHLLRIACSYKEVLRDKLVGINAELLHLHLLSQRVCNLSSESLQDFYAEFQDRHKKHILESVLFEFWEPMKTNYLMEFTEIRPLGVGGFGWVMLCVNKLDKRNYAVKIIPLEKREEMALKKENIVTDEVCREARTLAKLHHQHVVRYHHAWVEGAVPYQGQGSSSGSESASSSTEILNHKNNIHCLYIQMEYCAKTLSSHLEKCCFDEEFSLRVSRQIAKGLNHIHENGIVHRDLSPMNIFLDSKEDIKIGDFGLAKFLELDGYGKERWTRNSGAYGIPTYKAPELKENAKITQKVDMYSFGIILLELWNKFDSGNERAVVIMALKERNTMPPEWERKYPDLASLVRQLLSRNPAKRPSISQVLEGDLFRG